MVNIYYIQLLANKINIPYDQVLLISTICTSIPIGFINYFITHPTLRLIYGLITGFVLQYILYEIGTIHTIVSSVFTWYFIREYGRKKSAFWIFGLSFSYLSSMHIYRLFMSHGNWSGYDSATMYMMSLCRYSSLAFSYEDGGKEDIDLKKKHWKQYKIIDKPSLLEVFSFAFYYPTCIIGPSVEFKDFINYIHLKECYSRIPHRTMLKYGSCYFLFSFICIFFYEGFCPKFPLTYVGSVEFGQRNVIYRIVYLNVSVFLYRLEYYCGWLLSYACMILCGLSYNEVDENELKANTAIYHKDIGKASNGLRIVFDKGEYGSMLDCEFGLNPKTKITSWNRTIHLWLKYNLFLRMINIERKPFFNNYSLASFSTFMFSALWHGLYPTYYIFFFFVFVYQSSNETFDKIGFFLWLDKQCVIYKITMGIFSQFVCNSLGVIICNNKWRFCQQFLRNVMGLPIIFVLLLFGLSHFARDLQKIIISAKEYNGKAQ